jgi:hypothetical protein
VHVNQDVTYQLQWCSGSLDYTDWHSGHAHAVITAQATSAALGYLLLFIDQVGLIMGGPILHESMNQGSTSSVWQPPGFWTRQPRGPGSVLPLNILSTGTGAGTTASQAAYTSSSSRCVGMLARLCM